MQQSTKLPFHAVPKRLKGWPGFVWLLKQLWKPHRTQRTNVMYMRLMAFCGTVMLLAGLAGVMDGSTQVALGMWLGLFFAAPGLFNFVTINRIVCLTFRLENREHRLAIVRQTKDNKALTESLRRLRQTAKIVAEVRH